MKQAGIGWRVPKGQFHVELQSIGDDLYSETRISLEGAFAYKTLDFRLLTEMLSLKIDGYGSTTVPAAGFELGASLSPATRISTGITRLLRTSYTMAGDSPARYYWFDLQQSIGESADLFAAVEAPESQPLNVSLGVKARLMRNLSGRLLFSDEPQRFGAALVIEAHWIEVTVAMTVGNPFGWTQYGLVAFRW